MKIIISTRVLIYCTLLGLAIVVVGVVLGYRVFPTVVERKVWENSVLNNNTRQWDLFKKVPFPFQAKLYFFDVQNPEEILQGAKPIVKERGPYVYKLYRWKSDIEWNADEISYYEYSDYGFDQEASGTLSDEDKVTVLNAPFNAMIIMGEEVFSSMLSTLDTVLPDVFAENYGLFITATVKDLMFDGLALCENNGGDSFIAQLVCRELRQRAKKTKTMTIMEDRVIYANMFYKNRTKLGRFTVNSGTRDEAKLSDLIKYDDRDYMSVWKGEESFCNKIRGTTTFHPYVTKSTKFEVFGEDICRVLEMEYKNSETVKGVEGYKYAVVNTSFNTWMEESPEYCYCINRSRNLDGEFDCLKDGLLDLTACVGGPVLLSFPHLLYAHEDYKNSVTGMVPVENLHDTYVVLEPMSGVPLKMAKRVQFNMFIRAVSGISSIVNVSNALVPMFWIEESMTLSDEYVQTLKSSLFSNLKILSIVKWGLIGFGAVVIVLCLLLIVYQN